MKLSKLFGSLKPPKRESPSEFISNHRYLSSEISSAPGKWKNIPYQKEMMDCTEQYNFVVFQTGSQVGKTEILKNILYINLDIH